MKGCELKFVDRSKRCFWACRPLLTARALTAGLLFLLNPHAQAAVESFQEGVSSYSVTQDTYVAEDSPGTPQATDTVVKVGNSSDGWDFRSPEDGTAENRSLFTIDWAPGFCPGGNVTTTTYLTDNRSLRACVIWSNANSGTDTITVSAGTYTLTLAGTSEDAANTGDLDITDEVIINGDATWTFLFSVKMS